jgi:hypothetical protein
MTLRWEAAGGSAGIAALVARGDGVEAFADGALVAAFDATGQARDVAPAGGAERASRPVPAKKSAKKSSAKKKAAKPASPPELLHVAGAGDVVAAVDADGALLFRSWEGHTLGSLRLASTEPPVAWRLTACSDDEVVLAMGEWLVWVGVADRKVARRVRARAKVSALAADDDLVVAGCEGGWAQAFRAGSGEACGAFSAHPDEIAAVAVGPSAIFTAGAGGTIRAWERKAVDAPAPAAIPVTSLHAHGSLVAAGDRAGRVRLLRGARDAGSLSAGQDVVHVRVSKDETLLAVSSQLAIRAAAPWSAPRPIILRETASCVAADDDYLFCGTSTGAVDVYDLDRLAHLTTHRLTDGDVSALVRLPGALLVVGTGALDGRLFVIDLVQAKVCHRVSAHDDAFGVTALASDPRGRLVASGSDEGAIVLLDPAQGKVLARLRVRETPSSLAFEPSARRIACAFADGTAAIVSLGAKGASITDLPFRGVTRVAWGEDLVVGFSDGRVERGAPWQQKAG